MQLTWLILSLFCCTCAAIDGDTFTANCIGVTVQRSDPIIDPGSPGAHVLAVVGGNAFQRNMTGTSFVHEANATSCSLGLDHSNYFLPQLYYYHNKSYTAVQFEGNSLYYQKRACDYVPGLVYCNNSFVPQAFPEGFRMTAGNSSRRTYNDSDLAQKAISIKCDSSGYAGFPSPCNHTIVGVYFPSCWDGVNLDSTDHQSHMAYPVSMGQFDKGVCPQSHPVALFSLYMEFFFNTSLYLNDATHLTFSNGDTTGYGVHGGFINGWTNITLLQNAYPDCLSSANCPTLGQQPVNPVVLIVPAPTENVGLNPSVVLSKLPGNNPVEWRDGTCDSSCATCSGLSTNCTSCNSPYILSASNTCVCPSTTYDDGLGNCPPCDKSCATCSGNSSHNCLSCPATFSLQSDHSCACNLPRILDAGNNTCVCYPGTYDNGVGCPSCNGCKTCSGTATTCTSCASPYILNATSHACVCPAGTYYNGSITCPSCNSSCKTCSGTATKCTSCTSPYTLTILNTCVCPSGASCTTCKSPYILDLGSYTCVCPSGRYDNGSSCAPCNKSCLACNGSSAHCTSCSAPFSLQPDHTCACNFPRVLDSKSNTCVCPPGSYDNGAQNCTQCVSPCKTCSGAATTCTSCNSPFVLDVGSYICMCPAGSFADGSGNCTSCNSPYVLDPNSKTCVCPAGSYESGSGNCTSCDYPHVLASNNNTCVCAAGYFEDESGNCATCKYPYVLASNNKTCVCTAGYFEEESGNCTECKYPYVLSSNNKTCACATGYFEDESGNCSTCEYPHVLASNNKTCACVAGYFEDESGNCAKCKYPYVLDSNKKNCVCTAGYFEDKGGNCTKCNSPYIFDTNNKTCVCPAGSYDDGGKCILYPSCGDSICEGNIGENCSTCFFDCGACSYPTCGGTPVCSGRGTCNMGICECEKSYGGPDCGLHGSIGIEVTRNASTIEIGVPTANITFYVGVKEIREIDIGGKIISSHDLSTTQFNYSTENITLSDNSTATQISCNTTFPNNAKIIIANIFFPNATKYPFAGQTIRVPDQSLKISIVLQDWPFQTLQNRLQVVIRTHDDSAQSVSSKNDLMSSKDGSQNVQWLKLNVDGISLYTTFVEDIVKDGQISRASFSLDSDSNIILSTPSFWQQVEIDPVYTVLVDPRSGTSCEDCGNKKRGGLKISGKLIGGVVGGVSAATIILCVALFIIRKKDKAEVDRVLSKTALPTRTPPRSRPPSHPLKGETFVVENTVPTPDTLTGAENAGDTSTEDTPTGDTVTVTPC